MILSFESCGDTVDREAESPHCRAETNIPLCDYIQIFKKMGDAEASVVCVVRCGPTYVIYVLCTSHTLVPYDLCIQGFGLLMNIYSFYIWKNKHLFLLSGTYY